MGSSSECLIHAEKVLFISKSTYNVLKEQEIPGIIGTFVSEMWCCMYHNENQNR